jgi:hypothetical protein
MRPLALLAGLTVAVVLAVPASAAGRNPVIPPFIQNLVGARAGSVAHVPTRVPFAYRYAGYRWNGSVLTITLADRRFAVDGRHSIAFTARRFGGTFASCGNGREKTLQMGGNKVYWDGEVAWRCIRGANGRLVRVAASGPNLPDVALGRVVASGKRASSQR